jgi:hypothetical protein
MANELDLVWIQIQTPFSFIFKPSQMEHVWKLQILPHNYTNLNSHSRRSRQVRILGNLQDFSNVWTSNRFSANSQEVLLPEILIQILFGIWTFFQTKSCSLSFILSDSKVWLILERKKWGFIIYKFDSVWKNRKLGLTGWAHEQCDDTTSDSCHLSNIDRGPPIRSMWVTPAPPSVRALPFASHHRQVPPPCS